MVHREQARRKQRFAFLLHVDVRRENCSIWSFLFVSLLGCEAGRVDNSHQREAAVTAQRLPICFANVGRRPTRQTCYMATPVWRSHMV